MEKNYVIQNGIEMIPEWPERIKAAQQVETYFIDGQPFLRIRYGQEPDDWGADKQPCHDCGVIKGQLHVPGCDVERCPRCGGQVISCACPYEKDNTQ